MAFIKRWLKHVTYCYLHAWRFSGRDERQVFCDFYLSLWIIGLILAGGIWFLMPQYGALINKLYASYLIRIWIIVLWSILALFSAATRRGHDLDMSFWRVWFRGRSFGMFFYQHLCREEGSSQPNRFGPAPQANLKTSAFSSQNTFPDVWNG